MTDARAGIECDISEVTRWDELFHNMRYFLSEVDPGYLARGPSREDLVDGVVVEFLNVTGMRPDDCEILRGHLMGKAELLESLVYARAVSESGVAELLDEL